MGFPGNPLPVEKMAQYRRRPFVVTAINQAYF
jgi:hypothetical protein